MGFSRQESCSRLPFPSPEDLSDPWIEPESLLSPTWADRFLPLSHLIQYCAFLFLSFTPSLPSSFLTSPSSYSPFFPFLFFLFFSLLSPLFCLCCLEAQKPFFHLNMIALSITHLFHWMHIYFYGYQSPGITKMSQMWRLPFRNANRRNRHVSTYAIIKPSVGVQLECSRKAD